MTEEDRILNALAEKIDKLIDKEFEKWNYDRAYFEFVVKVNILNTNFEKVSEKYLINDEQEYHWCRFCRQPAYYYVDELEGYVCARCYKKIREVQGER